MNASIEIEIYAFQDSRVGGCYGYILHDENSQKTLAIDAGNAEPLLKRLEEKQWQLDELWITHHDFDHTDGLMEVKQATQCVVVGPKIQTKPIKGLDKLVSEGDDLSFAGQKIQILHVPGHTNDMLCYYFPQLNICFVGDLLFPLGCGRIKEGDFADMFSSLNKLNLLPDETLIFGGHEYAKGNAVFALSIEPDNEILKDVAANIDQQIQNRIPTVPTQLGQERRSNPFLRSHDNRLRQALGFAATASDLEVFTKVRQMKDKF